MSRDEKIKDGSEYINRDEKIKNRSENMNKNTKKIDNESEAIRENWYCLAICILRGCTPEQAFGLFSSGKKPPIRLNEDDYKIIKKYRDYGCTWVEIGRLYGLPDSELLNRIKHYKNSRLKNVAS